MKTLKQEVLRYLGYKAKTADKATDQMIEDCLLLLKNNISPKSTYQFINLALPNDQTVLLGEMTIKSKSLAKHFKGCCRAVLFAATLGAEADRIISRLSLTNVAKAAVMQASATAYIEEYCDYVCQNIQAELTNQNLYLTPRFSPGYGDFDISHQIEILNILKAQKNIGLTVTQSLMLSPTKSVTAVMGIGSKEQNRHASGCNTCDKVDCVFRKEE